MRRAGRGAQRTEKGALRGDVARVDRLYTRAVEPEPMHSASFALYAAVLADVEKGPDPAEEMFRRSREMDSELGKN